MIHRNYRIGEKVSFDLSDQNKNISGTITGVSSTSTTGLGIMVLYIITLDIPIQVYSVGVGYDLGYDCGTKEWSTVTILGQLLKSSLDIMK